jgi:hypothetical protein
MLLGFCWGNPLANARQCIPHRPAIVTANTVLPEKNTRSQHVYNNFDLMLPGWFGKTYTKPKLFNG